MTESEQILIVSVGFVAISVGFALWYRAMTSRRRRWPTHRFMASIGALLIGGGFEAVIYREVSYRGALVAFAFDLALKVYDWIRAKAEERSPATWLAGEFIGWKDFYRGHVAKCLTLVTPDGRKRIISHDVVFDNVKNRLPAERILFRDTNGDFEVPSDVEDHTTRPYRIVLPYFVRQCEKTRGSWKNGANARPICLIKSDGELRIDCETALYTTFLRTNVLLDVKRFTRQTLRERIHSDEKLPDLPDAKLANHLGIELLVLTADGSMLFQRRAQSVGFARGKLCAGSSGAVTIDDFLPNHYLPLTQMRLFRESSEEINLRRKQIDSQSIIFLGLSRDLQRGGKPELLVCARSLLTKEKIQELAALAEDNWEWKNLEFFEFGILDDCVSEMGRTAFERRFDEFLRKYEEDMTDDLLAALIMWKRWMTTMPSTF